MGLCILLLNQTGSSVACMIYTWDIRNESEAGW